MSWKSRMNGSKKKVELVTSDGTPIRVLEKEYNDLPDGFTAKEYENGIIEIYKEGKHYGNITKENFNKLMDKWNTSRGETADTSSADVDKI